MKKKLLSLFLCSALLLSISTEQKAACSGILLWGIAYTYGAPIAFGVVAGISVLPCGLLYGIYKYNHPTVQKTLNDSQALITSINDTYGKMLTVDTFDSGEPSLEQLVNAKNSSYSVNKYITTCRNNTKNLSWYQKKLEQHQLQQSKNKNIQLSSEIKLTLAEIEYTKSKMELLYKTLCEHKDYLLLEEQVDFMSSKINKRKTLNKNDAKKLQRLKSKVDLDEYPGLKEKVRLVSIGA